MKRICTLLILLSLAGGANAGQGDVVLIGHFSNIVTSDGDDPHQDSGYAVSLYQKDEALFGNVEIGIGSTEAASGRLYDIAFDPATKRLSFKAKYSNGWEGSKQIGPEGRESRVLMIFSGTLASKSLTGTIVLKDGYNLRAAAPRERSVMKRTKSDYKPSDVDEWARYIAPKATW